MRKFLAILSAALVGLMLAVFAGPAAAGPQARVSARWTISSDCVATVHASWGGVSGVSAEAPGLLITSIRSDSDTSDLSAYADITKKGGKATLVFTGTPLGSPETVRMSVYVNGVVANYYDKTAACAGWQVGTP